MHSLFYIAVAFATQLPFWIFAVTLRRDTVTDAAYATGFVLTASYAILFDTAHVDHPWSVYVAWCMVVVWAVRLGSYLAYRVHTNNGRDARFDKMRNSPLRFSVFWILQSVSIYIILLPFLQFVAKSARGEVSAAWQMLAVGGALLFAASFSIETIADYQKFIFKRKNKSALCTQGLWGFVRHPSYTGEIGVWTGIWIFAISQYAEHAPSELVLSFTGPFWITFLLLKLSGIPILERDWKKRYGEVYYNYTKRVPFRIFPGIY
eukprot:ANDGO_00343.mRNA.1 hypothetical protein